MASRYVGGALGRGVSFRTSSGLSTRARLAARVRTVGVPFGDGDGVDRKEDIVPRKELTFMRKKVALWSEGGFQAIEPVFLLLWTSVSRTCHHTSKLERLI